MNIWIAAADGRTEKVLEFLSTGQSPNAKDANGYTPLHAAAEYGHLELLQMLVDKGGDINVQDNDGDTPLHATEQVETAGFLKSLGADDTIKNNDNQTPLEKATEEGDFPDLIAFLGGSNGTPMTMRMTTTEEPEFEHKLEPEDRAKLGEIIENGTDADFEAFIQEKLGGPSSKRREVDDKE